METLTRPAIVPSIDWHVESVPYEASADTGDRGGVNFRENGVVFAFVLDALGHGSEAAQMANLAERHLVEARADSSLESIIEYCHRQLLGTRGTAMCLASIDPFAGMLTWLSVGNIQAVRVQLDSHGMPQFESLVLRGGVVGDRLPELRASKTALRSGDVIVLATDGVGYGWYGEYRPNISAETLAMNIRARHIHGKDDALVLVLRYRGYEGPDGADPSGRSAAS